MIKPLVAILFSILLLSCQQQHDRTLNKEILASLGTKYKNEFQQSSDKFRKQIEQDSSDFIGYFGLSESNILLFLFGFSSREETLPESKEAFLKLKAIDSLSSDYFRLEGMLSFLDYEWNKSQNSFVKAIELDPSNLQARHWYGLWLCAMGRFEEAMAQSDTIVSMDVNEDFLVGRSSFLYFQYRFEEMKPLTLKAIAKSENAPWAYDWLGMAYNGLNEHEQAISTYFKAFELSDGTVEVAAGLGHALGLAGEVKLAKQMADYYVLASKDRYLPPVQRSFIHLGIGEYEEAIQLLQQAYEEKSWFLIFMQTEHWYDPIRKDKRFIEIMNKMEFPNNH